MWLNRLVICGVLCTSMYGCGYNAIQEHDEAVKAQWSHVLNQYQRRADLIPNLVRVVKAYAEHEHAVFKEVTEARARLVAPTAVEANNPASLQKYIASQDRLKTAVGKLLAVCENYPQLKADGVFQDLQAQLEGTENRVTYSRQKYIESIAEYNILIRQFPSNMTATTMGYKVKPSFTVDNADSLSKAPTVEFAK